MEQEIKKMMNNQLLFEAARKFGVDVANLSYIGGFQNFIYEYDSNGTAFILRLTHSSHRSADQVTGELDWIGLTAFNS